MYIGAVHIDDIEVLGCGIISWKPPRGNEDCGGLGYVVRFFDGESYLSTPSSGYRSLQRYFDEIGRQWAVGEDLPTDGRTVYADVSGVLLLFSFPHFNVSIRSEPEMEN